ncbi:hypothetical protein [Nannocystis sp.]|uniref:hypothetical protein n=1 Tax=Nannocystis sp. TaxID=1962667 RepID=UPI0025D56DA8|nr:hypothetical protein [Nannocystis sp.]MBK7824372.1 hypothetical protein [Nannocystis sp.]
MFKGYVGGRPNTLSPVGDALIAPGLKSSLRTSLTYISSLMGHDFGGVLAVVVEAYQIRCAVAHNGGVVDSEAARRLPKLAKNLGKRILLFWKELLVYLDGIDKIAQQIDLTIPERPLSRTEARWLIQDSIDGNKKISAHEIRHRLANSHGLKSMPSAREISAEFGVPEGAKIVAK